MSRIILTILMLAAMLPAQEVMTAEDAIRIGLDKNYDIRIARNSSEIAENNRGKGTAGFLPTADATGSYQYGQTKQESNSPFSFGDSETKTTSAAASLNWTLFDGFQMFVNNERYVALAMLGKDQARMQIENTAVAILAAYFNLVQQEQLLDVAGKALEISRTRLEKVRVRQELGGASTTDLLNSEVAFNNDELARLEQELQVKIARKNLNILLANEPESQYGVDKQILLPPLDRSDEEILELVRQQNTRLLVARHDRQIADYNVSLQTGSFYPRVALSGSYSLSKRVQDTNREGFTDPIETTSQDALVGLNLTFNLFNGGRNSIDRQNAVLELRNKELALQNSENQIKGLVMEKLETYRQRMRLLEVELKNVEAATRNLQLLQDRYAIGAASSLEFRDAQLNLVRAENTQIATRYQARISRLEIDQLTGQINLQ